MIELARRNLMVERVEMSEQELKDQFAYNPYKIEIIEDKLEAGGGSTMYRQGEWGDLCLGPHVVSTAKLQHVRLTSVSSVLARQSRQRTTGSNLWSC